MFKVSVIIPNYNNAQWLEACIRSCLEQGEYLKEIIFVDDHSTDKSLKVVRSIQDKHPELLKIFVNQGKGANSARNFGFEKSSGDFIQWLDSDDRLLPGKFETQLKAFEKDECAIVYSDWRMDYYEEGVFQFSEKKYCQQYDDYLYELLKDNWTCSHNYLLHRFTAQKLHNIKAWNPKTKVSQDREYFTMAGILRAKFKYIPGTFSVYNRWSGNTISGIEFNKRLEENSVLFEKFRNEIAKDEVLFIKDKKKYFNTLNSHLIKSFYYNNKIRLSKFLLPKEINWQILHSNLRLLMPFILFYFNIKLAIYKIFISIRFFFGFQKNDLHITSKDDNYY